MHARCGVRVVKERNASSRSPERNGPAPERRALLSGLQRGRMPGLGEQGVTSNSTGTGLISTKLISALHGRLQTRSGLHKLRGPTPGALHSAQRPR
jgi:hypothetical protein